jgi:TonB-linked SusC/RagA family outer membrane protein
MLFLVATFSAFAQKRVVTGTIADPEGSPMPGVNVLVKGTNNGTATDGSGNYSIEASQEDVLQFSFIGYSPQEVHVGTQTKIDVKMTEDVATLQEVVVVGYGEMRRTDLSSAQTSISSDQINKTVNTTIEQAIQGRAANVYITQNTGQPGGGISVNIRGVNSINGSNEPLYVIDGIQIQPGNVSYGSASSNNPLAGLNPADIDNIEILQGPSATAIYGSRATNGVVLITTKRGKSGETKVSYGFLYSLQDRPKQLNVLDLPQYAQMYTDIRTLAGGTIPVEFTNPALLGPGTNWQNELFKTAPLLKHQLSLSGGGDKTTYYLSGESFDQDGIALGSGFKRNSVRLNVDNQVRSWLKIGTNLNFSQTNEKLSSTQENVINNALSLAPNIPVKNPNGTWGGADDTNGNSVQFTPLNPVAIANLVQNTVKRKNFLGGINAEVKIVKGLVFRTNFNVNTSTSVSNYFTPTYRLGSKTNDVASLSVSYGNNNSWNWNQLLQYNTKFGKHDVGVMVSHEAQESTYDGISGARTGFVTNDIPVLPIGNATGATNGGYKGHWAMESYFGRLNYNFNEKYFLQAALRSDGSANFGPQNRWGVFPSASAAWRISQEPFFQSITAVNEFKLRVETGRTGNQGSGGIYGPLSSITTPWGTGFLLGQYGNENLKWEQTTTNNIGFNIALLENRIQLEGDFYVKKTNNLLLRNPLPAYMGTEGEGSIAAPIVNIGALENRGWGFTLRTVNYDKGALKWESNFNISGFKTKVTKFYSETAFIERRPWYVGDTGSGNNWAQRAAIGEAPWLFRGYQYDGLFQSTAEVDASAVPTNSSGQRLPTDPNNGVWVGDVKFKDLNGDGIIDERDKTNIGNPWPKFNFGFSNTITWKNFALDILLIGVYGNDVFNLLRFNNTNPNNINLGRNLLEETFNYARVEGTGSEAHLTNPETGIPRITYNGLNGNRLRFTDQYVEDGSYIRVKNVQLRYSLPKSLLGGQNVIHGATLAIGAQNLFTFTKYKGYDPEVGAYVGRDVAADNQAIGLDYGRYPLTRVYTFSVNVDF